MIPFRIEYLQTLVYKLNASRQGFLVRYSKRWAVCAVRARLNGGRLECYSKLLVQRWFEPVGWVFVGLPDLRNIDVDMSEGSGIVTSP